MVPVTPGGSSGVGLRPNQPTRFNFNPEQTTGVTHQTTGTGQSW